VHLILPFALFLAFLALFKWRASREGMGMREWIDRRNARPLNRTWWIPLAVWAAIVGAAFIVSAIADHGFHWQALLVIPALAVFVAVSVWFRRLNQRQAERRLRE
jgi:amino acid transporter